MRVIPFSPQVHRWIIVNKFTLFYFNSCIGNLLRRVLPTKNNNLNPVWHDGMVASEEEII
jgi:hypothetical protein